MASFLADLGEQLRTDIADIARASVDPVFAQQQTEARFRREERESIREADLERIERQAQISQAKEALKRKSAVQFKLVEDALDQGRNTGDFSTLFNLTEAPGLLEEVRGHAVTAYESRFGRSWDAQVKEQELMNATRRLSQQDTANLLRSEELNSREELAMQRMAFEQTKLQYDQAQEVLRQNRDITNRNALVESIRGEKGIWTGAEKANIISSMNGAADSKTALKIYQQAWDNYWQKQEILERKARNNAKAAAASRPIQPSLAEQDAAWARIVEEPEFEDIIDNLEDESNADMANAFVLAVADTAKNNARDKTKRTGVLHTFTEELEGAFQDVKRGFMFETSMFGDTVDFSTKRLTEIRAQDVVVNTNPAGTTDDLLIRQAIRAQGLQPGDTFNHTFQNGQIGVVTVTEELLQ